MRRRLAFVDHELLTVIAFAAVLLGMAMPVYANALRFLESHGGPPDVGGHLLALVTTVGLVLSVSAALCVFFILADALADLFRERKSRDVTRVVRLVGVLACCAGTLAGALLALGAAAGSAPLAVTGYLLLFLGCLAAGVHFFPRGAPPYD